MLSSEGQITFNSTLTLYNLSMTVFPVSAIKKNVILKDGTKKILF